jgi:nicotinamide mononucleotide (NMN) deamidase PncC
VALRESPADIAMAVTGVAGPDPDEDGNPVGLVYISAATRDGRVRGAIDPVRRSSRNMQCSDESRVAFGRSPHNVISLPCRSEIWILRNK